MLSPKFAIACLAFPKLSTVSYRYQSPADKGSTSIVGSFAALWLRKEVLFCGVGVLDKYTRHSICSLISIQISRPLALEMPRPTHTWRDSGFYRPIAGSNSHILSNSSTRTYADVVCRRHKGVDFRQLQSHALQRLRSICAAGSPILAQLSRLRMCW